MQPLNRTLALFSWGGDDPVMFDWKVIGQKLRAARKSLGLNQTQMAARAGIAQTTLSDVENGRNTKTETLSALCAAAGLDLQVDLHPTGQAPPVLSPQQLEVAQLLSDLSPDDQAAFRQLLSVWQQLPADLRSGTLSQWRFFSQVHGTDSSRSTA